MECVRVCLLRCFTGHNVFLPVDQFVRLCREPVEGQSEVGSGGGQSSYHSRRASEGKSKLQQKKIHL